MGYDYLWKLLTYFVNVDYNCTMNLSFYFYQFFQCKKKKRKFLSLPRCAGNSQCFFLSFIFGKMFGRFSNGIHRKAAMVSLAGIFVFLNVTKKGVFRPSIFSPQYCYRAQIEGNFVCTESCQSQFPPPKGNEG